MVLLRENEPLSTDLVRCIFWIVRYDTLLILSNVYFRQWNMILLRHILGGVLYLPEFRWIIFYVFLQFYPFYSCYMLILGGGGGSYDSQVLQEGFGWVWCYLKDLRANSWLRSTFLDCNSWCKNEMRQQIQNVKFDLVAWMVDFEILYLIFTHHLENSEDGS